MWKQHTFWIDMHKQWIRQTTQEIWKINEMLNKTITHSPNHIKPNRFVRKYSNVGFATANNITIIIIDSSMILCELLQTHFVYSSAQQQPTISTTICPLNWCSDKERRKMARQGIVHWQKCVPIFVYYCFEWKPHGSTLKTHSSRL